MRLKKRDCVQSMRLMIDANILLDVLCKREPNYIASSNVWKLCETGKCTGYVSVLSFANIIYIMRKELHPEKIESILKQLALIFDFADLTENILVNASKLKWDDFEDAVQFCSAQKLGADHIITWNIKDYINSDITAITPSEFLLSWAHKVI